jgi:hypothetical protein
MRGGLYQIGLNTAISRACASAGVFFEARPSASSLLFLAVAMSRVFPW